MTEANTVLSESEVDVIMTRADKASVAPWEQRYVGSQGFTVWATAITRTGSMQIAAFGYAEGFDQDNAEFTAHAREDIPALCATAKALRAQLNQAEADRREALHAGLDRLTEIENLQSRFAEVERERDRFAALADERHDQLWAARRQRDDLAARCAPYLEQLK